MFYFHLKTILNDQKKYLWWFILNYEGTLMQIDHSQRASSATCQNFTHPHFFDPFLSANKSPIPKLYPDATGYAASPQ